MPGSSISSSDALRPTPTGIPAAGALRPTPSRVRAIIPAEAAAPAAGRARGVWTFAGRAALLLVVAALPVAFSVWVDPARLVASKDAEREIARVLASGGMVTDVPNYDDRAIEKFVAASRTERVEVLMLGSSRMTPMPASAFPGKRFFNAAVQGAVLDDLFGVYGLYDAAGRRPNRVVLNVDPWTESYDNDIGGWGAVADERATVMRRVGIPVSPWRERFALALSKWRTVASPEYFRLAVFSFRHHGARGVIWRVADQAQNADRTLLPNGTIVWKETTPAQAVAAAHAFATNGLDVRFHGLAHRAPGRAAAIEQFVRYLNGEGVNVTVLLVPFPPEVYDAALRMPGRTIADVERDLRSTATRAGAQVVGSYDPRVAGVTMADFFDEDHLKPEALTRLVTGKH